MKKLLLLALLFLTFNTFAATDTFKIGYVNMEHLVKSSPQFSQANQTIAAEFQKKKDDILSLDKKFQATVKKFRAAEKTLSEADLKTRLEAARDEEKILREQANALKDELEKRKQEELEKIRIIIDAAIKTKAEELELSVVLYENVAVAYINEKNNITALVKKQLRSLFK